MFMESNKQLSIVIPTYNRAAFLDYSLEVHIPLCKEHNIQIFIFDNASTDNTKEIIEKWMLEYPYLAYYGSEINIGPDANFERALKYPDTNYVWLLSDTYQIPRGGIEYLFKTINNTDKDYDVVVFNLVEKIKIPTRNYQNQNDLLTDLGAVMTCAAINVYNKKLISNADFPRYYNSNFIQTGIIFESISNRNFHIQWIQDYSVNSLNHLTLQKTNWSHTPYALEIGCEKWANCIFSLPPSYTIQAKTKCIMEFGKVSGLFTLRNLILLRALGVLNIQSLKKFDYFLALTIDFPKILIYGLGLIPKSILKIIIFIFIVLFKRKNLKTFKTLFLEKR